MASKRTQAVTHDEFKELSSRVDGIYQLVELNNQKVVDRLHQLELHWERFKGTFESQMSVTLDTFRDVISQRETLSGKLTDITLRTDRLEQRTGSLFKALWLVAGCLGTVVGTLIVKVVNG